MANAVARDLTTVSYAAGTFPTNAPSIPSLIMAASRDNAGYIHPFSEREINPTQSVWFSQHANNGLKPSFAHPTTRTLTRTRTRRIVYSQIWPDRRCPSSSEHHRSPIQCSKTHSTFVARRLERPAPGLTPRRIRAENLNLHSSEHLTRLPALLPDQPSDPLRRKHDHHLAILQFRHSITYSTPTKPPNDHQCQA